MAESAGEKTEEATPKRRQEARSKGSVAKSVDLTNACVMVAMLLLLPTAFSMMGMSFLNLVRGGYHEIPTDLSFQHIAPYFSSLMWSALPPFLMILGVAMTVGLVSNFAQVGFILSPEAMTPNLQKINPAKGIKNLFSASGLFTGVKALLKAGIFAYLAYSAIVSNWTMLGNLSQLTPIASLCIIGGLIKAIAVRIIIAWGAIAAIDYFIQKKQLDKNLKMSKDEVKQEFKSTESNPEMKGARIRKMRRMIRGNLKKSVESADVIVTNPTHFSVAIKYEKGKHAPTVVAKGQDLLAFRIREFAKEFEIPIVPNPPLARALYKQCEVGDYVPRELFQSVAEVLAYVYKTLKNIR